LYAAKHFRGIFDGVVFQRQKVKQFLLAKLLQTGFGRKMRTKEGIESFYLSNSLNAL